MGNKKLKPAVLVLSLLALVTGCENGKSESPLVDEINALKQEKTELTRQLKQSGKEVEQLKEQVEVLSELPAEAKAENLYHLQKVKITRYTNLYDKDKDGQYEKLIVYLQPIDEQGDKVKATGAVDVQLWDLNKEADEALLGQWQVGAAELKELWFATLVTINYRLTFDVADKITEYKEPLTVKVKFTDYLTGKVFDVQKVIQP
ncbi:MAG: hypothetical protein ACYS1A_13545 [Planctomycetota bacterium]